MHGVISFFVNTSPEIPGVAKISCFLQLLGFVLLSIINSDYFVLVIHMNNPVVVAAIA